MRLLKPLSIIALIYVVAALLLFWGERLLVGEEVAQQALPIVVLSGVYFAYSLVFVCVLNAVYGVGKRHTVVTGFHLINNVVRFFLSILLLAVYAVYIRVGLILFSVNLMVYYLITVIYTGWLGLQMERLRQSETATNREKSSKSTALNVDTQEHERN